MGQPCFYVVLLEEVQICPHHVYLRILLVFITQDAVLVSAIVVIGEVGATRFMEVFGPTIGWRLWRLLFPSSGKQSRIRLVVPWIYEEGFNEKV